jgi:hypothetical protein
MKENVYPRSKSKTRHYLAIASGTFVVTDDRPDAEAARQFESAVDSFPSLQRTGPVEVSGDGLRCPVEYGPVFGAYESDLWRYIDKLPGDKPIVIEDYSRRKLTAEEAVSHLEARLEKAATLPEHERVSQATERLRRSLARAGDDTRRGRAGRDRRRRVASHNPTPAVIAPTAGSIFIEPISVKNDPQT